MSIVLSLPAGTLRGAAELEGVTAAVVRRTADNDWRFMDRGDSGLRLPIEAPKLFRSAIAVGAKGNLSDAKNRVPTTHFHGRCQLLFCQL